MAEEPHYRDSVKKLDLKIRELAELELKGKDTIRHDILCEILKIPKEHNVRTKEAMIRESLVPICFKRNISLHFLKHQIMCNHFQIPVYHRPKIDMLIKFRILEVLVKASPKAMSSRGIAEILGETTGKVSAALCSYHRYQNPWFERITGENGKKPYTWKASEEGIKAYHNGEARLLKRKQFNPVPPGTSKRPRRCTVKTSKVLAVLAKAPYALTVGSIAAAASIDTMIIQDILKYDQASKMPFFERIRRSGEKGRYRWQASREGMEYYFKQMRRM